MFGRTSSAVALRIAYGYTVLDENDPVVDLVNSVMSEFSESITPGAFLVDVLPICKHSQSPIPPSNNCSAVKHVPSWMPGAGFQRKAKVWADHVSQMLKRPFKQVEDELVSFVPISLVTSGFQFRSRRKGQRRIRLSLYCCSKVSTRRK